jgi:hypothetical protein
MDPEAHRQCHAPLLLQAPRELPQSLHDPQAGAHGALSVIFMGAGVAEVDQEAIAEILRDMPIKAGDHLGAGLLIGAHHLPQVFRVELSRKDSGVDQVTEQDGELAPFGVRRGRSNWSHIRLWRWGLLRDRGLERLQRWERGCREHRRPTRPHHALLVLADHFPVRIA